MYVSAITLCALFLIVEAGTIQRNEESKEVDNSNQSNARSWSVFYSSYKLGPTLKAGQTNWLPFKKRGLLEIKKSSTLRYGFYGVFGQYGWQYNVLSCPTFDLPCTVGYLKFSVEGGYSEKFCGSHRPWHAAPAGQYVKITYVAYAGVTLDRELKCFVSGTPGTTASGLTQSTPTPYCDSVTTPAPETYATQHNCVCGVEQTSTSRIVGGSAVEAHGYPWVVLIHFKSTTPEEFHCAGTLISDQWVATAASCVYLKSPSELKVSVGNNNLGDTSTGQSIEVLEFYDFGYDAFQHKNDIILLKLATVLDIRTDPTVKPICLPSPCDSFDLKTGTAAGWGHIDASQQVLPNELHGVSMTIADTASCNTSWGGVLTDDMICAGDTSASACVSDLGAPLWVEMPSGQNVLAGIHSFADACSVTVPGIYTNVKEFLSEIRTAITGSGVCQLFYY